MITGGAIPYSSYNERMSIVQQLKQEFENKVRIKYNDNDGLLYYEHFDGRKDR
jgi:hypothetical protein